MAAMAAEVSLLTACEERVISWEEDTEDRISFQRLGPQDLKGNWMAMDVNHSAVTEDSKKREHRATTAASKDAPMRKRDARRLGVKAERGEPGASRRSSTGPQPMTDRQSAKKLYKSGTTGSWDFRKANVE